MMIHAPCNLPGTLLAELQIEVLEPRLELGFFDWISDVVDEVVDFVEDTGKKFTTRVLWRLPRWLDIPVIKFKVYEW